MYKHLSQEKKLLEEKMQENKDILDGIQKDISKIKE
jgi:hypothetical protein